jgi:hypothetical protein
MIIVLQPRSLKGPFCRDCGLAAVRKLSADTLWQGWWGYFSIVAAPMTLLINFAFWLRVRRLATPTRPAGWRGADPGRPLLLRPAAIGFLIPIALILIIVAAISH